MQESDEWKKSNKVIDSGTSNLINKFQLVFFTDQRNAYIRIVDSICLYRNELWVAT